MTHQFCQIMVQGHIPVATRCR